MNRAVISLGSNIGDRLAHLQGAVDALAASGVAVVRLSGVYETAPVGGPEQDDFLNAIAIVHSALDPRELLALCQQVEADHERVRDIRWGPRTLDVDIIHVDGVRMDEGDLTLPHPRAHERAFVCVPWLEVDPLAVIGEQGVVDLPLDDDGVTRRDDLALTVPGEIR